MTNHDSSYHLLFSHPELVEDLLRHFVPEDWVDQLDFSSLQRVNAKFHADGLEKREGDIIYRIDYKNNDGEIYLYLLFEFQSTPDKWMALRTLVYVGLLYQQLTKEKQLTDESLLPPVFPLVLYNGDQPWPYPQDVKSLIALPPHSPLQKWQPQINYYLLEERRYPQGKDDAITGLIFAIENIQNLNDLRDKIHALDQRVPHATSLYRALLTWIKYVIRPYKGLKLELDDIQNLSEVGNMLGTRIEKWEQEIEEKGLEKGRQEGVLKGEALLLTRLLTLKFGLLPQWAADNIATADKDTLENWGLRLMSADTLDQVFE